MSNIFARFTLVLIPLFFCGILFGAQTPKSWPAEAKAYLEDLPEQTLSLEFVVGVALKQADIFTIHKTDLGQAESSYMRATAAEDFVLYGGHSRFNDESEPLSPFQPQATKGWENKLGIKRYLSTGTSLSLEGVTGRTNLSFTPSPGSPGVLDRKVSKVSLGFEQNLLGDSFGSGYRALRRAADHSRRSIQAGALKKIESSTLDIINLYYSAWLKKQLTVDLAKGRARKNKLLRIFRSKKKRGTAESSDVLQVESVTINSDADYLMTKQELQDLWERLVISLKMPRSFLEVDAMTIPMKLDSPEEVSIRLCLKDSFETYKENSNELREAEQALKANKAALSASKKALWPEVKLQGSYTLNGVEPVTSKTLGEIGDSDHPGWSAGVAVNFPLQNKQKKAEALEKKFNYERARAGRDMVLGNLESRWRSLCGTLKQKRLLRDKYRIIFRKNKKRVSLQNRRFRVGRISATEWVQAEDDEAQSNFRYQQSEVEVRQIAWQVQQQTGDLYESLKSYVEER